MDMTKKIARVVTEESFPRLFQKELKKAGLDKVNVDNILDSARVIRENEQNLKDLGGLKKRLDILDKIMTTVDKIAGGIDKYDKEQTLNSKTLSDHNDRLEKVEKHLNLPVAP